MQKSLLALSVLGAFAASAEHTEALMVGIGALRAGGGERPQKSKQTVAGAKRAAAKARNRAKGKRK